MKLVSARWVVPIDAPADRRRRGRARGRRRGAGGRRPRRAARRVPRRRSRSARRACCCPAWSTRTATWSCPAHADAVPGGKGLFAWATALMRRAQGRHARASSAKPRPTAAGRGRRARHRGHRRRRQLARRRARHRPRRPGGRAVPRAVRLARGRRPATRWPTPRASAPRPPPDWPERLGYVPAPHAPYSAGPELLAPHLRGGRRPPGARRRSTSPRTKTSSRCCATAPAAGPRCWPAWASTRRRACPRKSPVAYLASLGAFADRDAAAARPHGPRRRRRPAHRPRGGRDRRALPALEPAHRRPPARRRRAASPTACRSRIGTDSLASVPDLSLWAEMATLAAHFPAVPAARWLDAATRGGARALGLRGARRARRPARGPACSTCWSTTSPPRSNRWCAIRPRPCAGWRAHDRHAP